jgi:hypothetical protein
MLDDHFNKHLLFVKHLNIIKTSWSPFAENKVKRGVGVLEGGNCGGKGGFRGRQLRSAKVFVIMPINQENWEVRFIVFNATFKNISAISWQSVLLVEETRENHWPAARHWQTLSQNIVHLALSGIRTHNICGDRCRLHR